MFQQLSVSAAQTRDTYPKEEANRVTHMNTQIKEYIFAGAGQSLGMRLPNAGVH